MSLYMKSGFEPGQDYELSYTAKNTPVGGLGYTALRDVGAEFRKPGALVTAKYEYMLGVSQTARVVREFLYAGLNADEQGHKVFDLLWAHIGGAGRGDFMEPFSLPNGQGAFTGTMFPYSDAPQRDPDHRQDRRHGDAYAARRSCPRSSIPIPIANTGGRGRAAALLYTALDGKKDRAETARQCADLYVGQCRAWPYGISSPLAPL